MPCYHPMIGYRSRTVNANGKRPIVFNPNEGYSDMRVELPCGQCIGCRLERARTWAIRCMHEASQHEENCFITLTFAEVNELTSLVKSDFQKFMKRLRKKYNHKKILYFHCGEYGETYGRPHHHACLFGIDFPDKELFKIKKGVRLYTSKTLSALWPYGFSTIGDVTFESACYVAGYITKKITGKNADDYYGDRVHPYVTMSRRPGIGRTWLKKYVRDVYPHDEIIIRKNKKCHPPKYYDNIFEVESPGEFETVKKARVKKIKTRSTAQLRAGEVIANQKQKIRETT